MDSAKVYEFEWLGILKAKKNQYMPRRDRPGFFKNHKLQDQLDHLAMQIPGYIRDLRLESPDLEFWFWSPRANFDRDGAITTALDLLSGSPYYVLVDDNVAHCNGTITIHPCEYAEEHRTVIRITETSENRFARPARSRKRKTTADCGG